ncbi:MAG: killer suppression protein [Verrucomicrobiota bacterium]|nr:killer suppression protein [Verrucomicrobiota bacterium]
MEVTYRTTKLQKLASNSHKLKAELGPVCAKKFEQRISEFMAADCLEDLRPLPGPRIHELKGDRKGQFSADLKHPLRLIFLPTNIPEPRKNDGGWDWAGINMIEIQEITDTHE